MGSHRVGHYWSDLAAAVFGIGKRICEYVMWFSRSTALRRSVKGICVKQWNEKKNSGVSFCQQNHENPNPWVSFSGVIWNVFPATRMSVALQCLPPLRLASKYQEVALPLLLWEHHPSCYICCFSQHCPLSPPLTCGCFCILQSLQKHQSGDQRDKKMSSIPGPEFHGHIPTQPSLELWNSWSSLPFLSSEDDSKKLAGIDWTNNFRDLELCCIWNENEIQVHSSLYKTLGAKYVLEFRILSNGRKVNQCIYCMLYNIPAGSGAAHCNQTH